MVVMKSILGIIRDLILWVIAGTPTLIGVRVRRFVYPFLFKLGSGSNWFAEKVTILGFKNIKIGVRNSIMKNSYLYANNNGKLIIGDGCSINSNVQIGAASGEIEIGNNVLIGPNVVLRAADHRIERTDIPIIMQGHVAGKIIIEDDVWICSNVVITKDVVLGKGCVVSSGAVVTRDVPPFSVVGGVPAEVIRYRKSNICKS